MKKQLTQEEKVTALTAAIQQADKTLDWMLEPSSAAVGSFASGRRPSEWSMTTARRVRNILRRALAKVQDKEVSHVDR